MYFIDHSVIVLRILAICLYQLVMLIVLELSIKSDPNELRFKGLNRTLSENGKCLY